jgi:3-(3-hydroxy-phenyl)propionate hydroxylase
VVIDIVLKDGADVTDELHTHATTAPGRTYTFVPTGENRRRIEFKALEEETDESLEQEDNVWKLLEKWVTPETATIERADTYQFNALLAKPWREGRLFIAGDAAHQKAPKAGQGMCSGLRDALNLSWKLAFCVNGRASSSLLDTYESERSPHSRIWIQISEGIAKAIDHLSAGGKPEIQGEQKPASRLPIGPGLHGDKPPPAGLLSVQPILDDGTKLDDRVGLAFAVIAAPEVLDACEASTRESWAELGAVVLSASDAGYEGYLKGFGASAIVIRPDKYIFGTADSAAGLVELTETLKKALGSERAVPAGDSK